MTRSRVNLLKHSNIGDFLKQKMANAFEIAAMKASGGGYTDKSGYHDSSGNLIATTQEIQQNPDAARQRVIERLPSVQRPRSIESPISNFEIFKNQQSSASVSKIENIRNEQAKVQEQKTRQITDLRQSTNQQTDILGTAARKQNIATEYRNRQLAEKIKQEKSNQIYSKTIRLTPDSNKPLVTTYTPPKPGDVNYVGSERHGTTRTLAEAEYEAGQLYDKYKEDIGENVGELLNIKTNNNLQSNQFIETFGNKESTNIFNPTAKVIGVDTKDKNVVYGIVNAYRTGVNKINEVMQKAPTSYDAQLLNEKISFGTGFKTTQEMSKAITGKRQEVRNVVNEYSGINQELKGNLIGGSGQQFFSDYIIASSSSPQRFDTSIEKAKTESEFQKKIFENDIDTAFNVIKTRVNKETGDNGKIFFSEGSMINYLDLADTRADKEIAIKKQELSNIEKGIKQQDTDIENTFLNTKLSSGKTAGEVVAENKNQYLKMFNEDTKTSVEAPTVVLATYAIKDDLTNQFKAKEKELRSKDKGEYKNIINDDGTQSLVFYFNTQEDLDADTKLHEDYNKEMNNYINTVNSKLSNYGIQQNEIESLMAKQNEIANIAAKHTNTVEAIRGMDFTYNKDKNLTQEINKHKFGNTFENINVGAELLQFQIDALGTGISITANTGRMLGRDVGGLIVKGLQGTGQIIDKTNKKLYDSSYSDIVYDASDKYNIGQKYEIDWASKKAGRAGLTAGVVALGAVSGGAGWGIAAGTALTAQPMISGLSEEFGYVVSSKDKKAIMKDYGTFSEGMRQAWDAENQKISTGWDNQKGGIDGTIRSGISNIPLSGYIPGIGAQPAFKENITEYYKNLGYTGAKLDAAVKASTRQRNFGIGGEAVSILGGNIASEIVGRRALTKAFLSGATSNSFWTGFTKVGSAGIVEGALLEQARQDKEYEKRDYGKVSQAGIGGYLTAGAIGGGMVWSGAGGKLFKVLEKGGYWTDWYEKPGDILANVAEKNIKTVSMYTGKVNIRPKVFTFVTTNSQGANTNIKINAKDTPIMQRTASRTFTLTLSNGQTYTFTNTKANSNTLLAMQTYIDNESKTVLGENEVAKIGPKAQNDALFEAYSKANKSVEPNAKTDAYTNSDVYNHTFTDVFSNTNVKNKTDVDIQSDIRSNIGSQTNTNTNTNTNVNANANAMTGVFSSMLPYGRVMLPQSGRRFGFGNYSNNWITENKIADYAGDWLKKQRDADTLRRQNTGRVMQDAFGRIKSFPDTFTQSSNYQSSGSKKQPDGYDNAKNAVDRMFGRDIASGNQFKQTFASNKQRNMLKKQLSESRTAMNFREQASNQALAESFFKKDFKTANSFMKKYGKSNQ